MKLEQALNTPAAAILIALALQDKAEVLTFVRLGIERQEERGARPISGTCVQSDGFDILLRYFALPFCFYSLLERGREASKNPKQTNNPAGITSARTQREGAGFVITPGDANYL